MIAASILSLSLASAADARTYAQKARQAMQSAIGSGAEKLTITKRYATAEFRVRGGLKQIRYSAAYGKIGGSPESILRQYKPTGNRTVIISKPTTTRRSATKATFTRVGENLIKADFALSLDAKARRGAKSGTYARYKTLYYREDGGMVGGPGEKIQRIAAGLKGFDLFRALQSFPLTYPE
jgi:hypothetical protein